MADFNIQNVSSKVSSDGEELMAKTLTSSKVSSDGDNSNIHVVSSKVYGDGKDLDGGLTHPGELQKFDNQIC